MKKYILVLVSVILILLVPFITLKIMNNYDYLASLDLKKFINSGNAITFILLHLRSSLSIYRHLKIFIF